MAHMGTRAAAVGPTGASPEERETRWCVSSVAVGDSFRRLVSPAGGEVVEEVLMRGYDAVVEVRGYDVVSVGILWAPSTVTAMAGTVPEPVA